MNILILGGNRFTGKLLAEELLKINNSITVFNRRGTGPHGCRIIQGDRNATSDLKKINFQEFDCIIDMCLYKPQQFVLLEPLLEVDTPYVFISSAAAYKDVGIWPITESSEIGGMEVFGDYGRDKARVESLIKKSKLEKYKIMRPTYIIGEGNHDSRLGRYVSAIEEGKPIDIAGDGENLINLVTAQDIVNCLKNVVLDMCSNTGNEIKECNLSSDQSITVNYLIELLVGLLNKTSYLNRNYNASDTVFPYAHYGIFSNQNIKNYHSCEFTDLKEALTNYIQDYNNNK